jgi:Trk-type K+ transport system membrane component
VPENSSLAGPIYFLRAHPRRVFYLLFPAYETWVYAAVVAVLTVADWILFEVRRPRTHGRTAAAADRAARARSSTRTCSRCTTAA